MFDQKSFVSHAGISLDWKIECDDLTDEDLATLAKLVANKVTFSDVHGIPSGGIRFANALRSYVSITGPRLLVDDVFSTGMSMREEYQRGDIGVVIFSRGIVELPTWITAIFECKV